MPAGDPPHARLTGSDDGLGLPALQLLATSEIGSYGMLETVCWGVILTALGLLAVVGRD